MHAGGKRKGAGRPIGSKAPHTIETEALRAYLISRVIAEQEQIITALIEKAKNGDISAAKELLDRSIGRVRENVAQPAEFALADILKDIQNRKTCIVRERVQNKECA